MSASGPRGGRCAALVLALGAACASRPGAVLLDAPGSDAASGSDGGDAPPNACGGPAPLAAEPGMACAGACRAWRCDGADAVRCVRTWDGARCPGFADVTVAAGFTPNPPGLGPWGGGAALADLDGDGALDVLRAGTDAAVAYRGDGRGHFADASAALGVGAPIANGVLAADWDADGWVDVVGTNFPANGPLRLLMGGPAGFADGISAMAGVQPQWSIHATWGDYDRDGDLDLYVAEREGDRLKYLYRNDAGLLVDVTAEAGVADAGGRTYQTAWLDFDLDGDLDLYVANDKGSTSLLRNRLYRNEGDGTFSDVSEAAGVAWPIDAMGVSVGDYDDDGDADLYVTNAQDTPVAGVDNLLFVNQGDGTFVERSRDAGVGLGRMSWGALWLDADDDGALDLLVSSDATGSGPCLALYVNRGSGVFDEVAADNGMKVTGSGSGLAAGDMDGDGDLDVVAMISSGSRGLYYFRNEGGGGHWLEVAPRAGPWNPTGVGARVVAVAGGRTMTRWVDAGGSYLSTSAPAVHFGLGAARAADVTVYWPDGGSTALGIVDADQHIDVSR